LDSKAPEAFRTISEVADELDLPQHVLRFWETRFRGIKPMKRGGGRRYYRPDDIDLLRGIRHLLYGEGYTIRGAQRVIRERGVRFVQEVWQQGAPQPPHGVVEEDAAEEVEVEIEVEEAFETTEDEGGGFGSRLAGLVGRDLSDRHDDAPRRDEPPLESAPMPRVEPADRTGHAAAAAAAPPAARPAPTEPKTGLAREDRSHLHAVLHELRECRRLIDAAAARDAESGDGDVAEARPSAA
jgi:DNA-binding transcriptional MerR regulator